MQTDVLQSKAQNTLKLCPVLLLNTVTVVDCRVETKKSLVETSFKKHLIRKNDINRRFS